jgi:glycosyltransferase involved in cell wall biosynthesis
MRILYVSQYFPPEMGAPSARVHELSREWVRAGHEVEVLTAFAHHPTGVKAPEDRWVLTRREEVDGIKVVRTYVYATPNKGVVRRMLSYLSFMLSAVLIGFVRVRRPDVVIATSPQLLCGVAGYLLARLMRARFVFEVRDLWPESLLAVEVMRENVIIRALRSTARYLYKHSDSIVTVGHGYRDSIVALYGIAPQKIAVVPNGVDTEFFTPSAKANDIRQEYNWGDRFVVLYAGTLGMAHALEQVLETAKLLLPARNVLFVFVGEGAEKERLKALAAEWQLANVQFIDQQPKARIVRFYAACEVGLVSLRDTPLFQSVLPSKIFEYLAMERPILLTVGGEARKLVETAQAGEFVPPSNVPALAEAIRRLAREPEKLAEMGRSGRQFVCSQFSRARLATQYADVLRTLCTGALT